MNQFLEACGATGPLLLNVEAPGIAGEARGYDLPFVLIGKDPRCDLRLDHPEVSPRHAYVQLVNGRLLCADLGSRSGVHQGGKRRRLGWLDRERAVRIGPYRIRLLSGDNHVALDPSETDDVLGGGLGRGKLVFELSHRSVRLSRCEIDGGLALVGSAADCEVRLIDPSVTSYHCALVPTPEGVWVVDLLGQGGIRINGHEVSYGRLSEGDSLQLGHSLIRMVAPDEAASVIVTRPEPAHESLKAGPRTFVASTPKPPVSPPPGASSWPQPHVNRLNVDDSDDGYPPEGSDFWPDEANAHEDGIVFGNTSANGTSRRANSTGGELALPMSQAVELVERVLAPMLGQVGVMQQQMVDELHQSRATMFEMFSALQQEQTSALDHELDQIRLISQELNLFRADLERQAVELSQLTAKLNGAEPQPLIAAKPTAIPMPAPAPKPVAAETSLQSSVTMAAAPPTPRAADTDPKAAPVPVPIALPDRSARILPRWDDDVEHAEPEAAPTSTVRIAPTVPAVASGTTTVNGKSNVVGGPSVISAAPTRIERTGPLVIPSLPVPKVVTRTGDAVGPINVEPSPTIRNHDENIHNELCQRIVKIREEHQSRWKKLLSKIPGAGSMRSTP